VNAADPGEEGVMREAGPLPDAIPRPTVVASCGLPPVALKETCRVVSGGRVPLWPLHRERLAEGGCAETLLAEADDLVALAAAEHARSHPRTARLRLTLTVSPTGELAVQVARRLSSLDVPGGPVGVAVTCEEPPPVGHGAAKPADRSWWDARQREARTLGGHQALIADAAGVLVDGGTASVWLVDGSRLLTPPAPPAIAGVARRFVMREAAGVGLFAEVTPLAVADLDAADEVFVTNAFGGAVALRGRGGPATARVAALFARIWDEV
jgi:branched-subunit amino acid aminotransferase/4-amino-4-deoxychorismate lyase